MAETPTQNLRYPLDDTEYKAKVKFTLVENAVSGEAATGSFKTQIERNQAKIKQIEAQYDQLKSELDTEEISQAQYQEKLDALKAQVEDLKKQISEWEGQSSEAAQAPTIDVSKDTIQLYLPLGLAFRDNVTYENFDLGAAGAAMEGGLGFAESMVKGIGSFVSGLTGGSGADVAKLAGIQLSSKFGSFAAEAGAVQKLAGGVTLNPNTRVLFKQPNIREFSFAFKFISRSQKEAEEVNKIIKFFRTELYPSEIAANVGDTEISLGYRFPNKFNISFSYNDDEIPGLAKLKPCYLRDVSTTYNSSAMAMHSDGNFTEIDMTLSFQETKALVRSDIEEGF